MTLTAHRIAAATFDDVAAGRIDARCREVLGAGQLSRHLLLLRAVVAQAGPQAAEAVDVLAAAQRADPAAFATVLGYPYVGAWAAQTLRRVRAGGGTDGLDALAAAAAIRAGVEVDLPVRVLDGALHLPTLGTARHDSARQAVVRCGPAPLIRFPDRSVRPVPGATGWQEVRRLGGAYLDDLHPDRGPDGMTPLPRLDAGAYRRWVALHAAAERALTAHAPAAAGLLPLQRACSPLVRAGRRYGVSATSRFAFGAIALTTPDRPTDLAATLVHELRHTVLNALMDLVPLIQDDPDRRYYSPWRRDPRPLSGILHGAYAFLGVVEFRHGEGSTAGPGALELSRTRAQVAGALDTLERSDRLLPAGRRFVTGLRASLARFDRADVDPRARSVSETLRADHRISWRLRHVRPDPADVRELADRWVAGRAAGPATTRIRLTTSTDGFVQADRAALLARTVSDPGVVDGPELRRRWPELIDGDVPLARGDHREAVRRYTARLDDRPDDPAAWSGLALACAASADTDERAVWLDSPELVRAVWHRLAELGRPAPARAVARWLVGDVNA